MTIEALLIENNDLLKQMLTTLQTQQTAVAVLGSAEFTTASEKKPRATKKADTQAQDAEVKNTTAETTATATTEQKTADIEPSVTAQPDTASEKTSAPADAKWADVFADIKAMALSTEPHLGKVAVRKLVDRFIPGGTAKVPELEALGKNAEIAAAVAEIKASADDGLGV